MNTHLSRINITIPEDFLKAVDKAARDHLMSRSTFIRLALMQKMKWKNMRDGPEEDHGNNKTSGDGSKTVEYGSKTIIGSSKLTQAERNAMFEKLYTDS